MMTDIFVRLLLPMGLAGGLFWLLLQPARPLLAQLRAGWRKTLLMACAVLFLLPLPLLFQQGTEQAPAPVAQALETAAPTAPVYQAGRALGQAARPAGEATTPTQPNNTGGTPIDVISILAHVYWIGAALSLGIAAARHARLMHRLDAGCDKVANGPVLAQYEELCRDLGLTKAPTLYQSGDVSSPILAGLMRSRIILPSGTMAPHQLRFALLHELCHFKNRDLPMKYLMLLASSLHWYNPAAHLLRREFADACEQSCDEAVAQLLGGEERRQYAAVLLDFAGPASPALVSSFSSPASRLKARLRRLMRPKKPGKALQAAGAILPCALLVAAVLAGCSLAAGAGDSSVSDISAPSPASSIPVSTPSSLPASSLAPESISQSQVSASDPEYVQGSASTLEDDTSFAYPDSDTTAYLAGVVSDGVLKIPVPDYEFISRTFETGSHRGTDFNAPKGSNIVACADGTVLESGWHYSFGYYVEIDHGNGLRTLYAHNEKNFVEKGQTVKAGDLIATVGSTGNSSGKHCHLEVTQDGELANPLDYFTLQEEK